MNFGSLFAGIGGFDLGFEQAGMRCVWQVENDKYCSAVLQRHWPLVERRGDIIGLEKAQLSSVDLVCGGFPCQDVSVAGNRKGLAGERSGLWSEFHRILEELRPSWVVVENVTGLLSSQGGRDFATILQALVQLRYGVAWRVLDAQYFGVPQLRRRVFIVGHLGDGRAAEVLFESEGGAWNPPPSREARTEPTSDATVGFDKSRGTISGPVAGPLRVGGGRSPGVNDGMGDHQCVGFSMASHPLGSIELAEPVTQRHGDPGCVARAITIREGARQDISVDTYIAVAENQRGEVRLTQTTGAVSRGGGKPGQGYQAAITEYGVRRLTPTECTRLQGFPSDWLEVYDADAEEARSRKVLHSLWKEAHQEAMGQREAGVYASLLTPQILLAGVYGGWISWEVARRCAETRRAIQGENYCSSGFLQALRVNTELGRSPYRRESFAQCARELDCVVSDLPLSLTPSPTAVLHRGVQSAPQGTRLLQQTLSEMEEVGQPDAGEGQPTHVVANGPLSDSRRYKQLGNAVCVPVSAWIGRRIIENS